MPLPHLIHRSPAKAPLVLYPSAWHDKGDAVAAPTEVRPSDSADGISEGSTLPSLHLAEVMLVGGMVCM